MAVLVILAAIVVGIYGQTVSFDYVFDDQGYLISPPEVHNGLAPASVRWALQSSDYGNWFPLTRLSWLTDVELFGMDPGPAHLVNALVHLAAAWGMFLVLAAATGLQWRSAALAALWAAHPLQVETVAWVTERSLLLATFFLWTSLGAYLAYVRRPGAWNYLLALLGTLLSFLSKPILLALPLLLLLLDWWPLGRWKSSATAPADRRLLILEKLPFAVLVVVFAFRAAAAQSTTGALASMDALSIVQRAGNALRGGMWYVAKSALPAGLGVFYPLSPESAPIWRTAAAAALLAAISFTVLRAWRSRPQALAGWLWFALTLLPVSGLVQTGSHSTADRFAYIPLAGLLVMASGLLVGRGRGSRRSLLLGAVTAVAVISLSAASRAQTRYWHNELSLFGRALAVAEVEHPLIRNHLAKASERVGDYGAAGRHYEIALRLQPDLAYSHHGLGRLMARQGDFDGAERHLREAVRIVPGFEAAREDLDDLMRCRQETATAAACIAGTILARTGDRHP